MVYLVYNQEGEMVSMDKREMMEWAVSGLETKLEVLDRRIRQGRRMLTNMENRPFDPKQPKDHVSNLLRQDLAEYDVLDKKRHDLEWELVMMREDEK